MFKSAFVHDTYEYFPHSLSLLANGWSSIEQVFSTERHRPPTEMYTGMSYDIDHNHILENIRLRLSRRIAKYNLKIPTPTVNTQASMAFDSQKTISRNASNSPSKIDESLDARRENLLSSIRDLLMRDKEYYLAEKAGRSKADQTSDNYDITVYDLLFEDEVEKYDENKWWTLITKSKPISQALQKYIETTENVPANLEAHCLKNVPALVVSNLGNYVIQKMLSRSLQLLEAVVTYCIENFWQLLRNEFASRVMQLLVSLSDSFRTSVFDNFKQDHDAFFGSVAGVFLASVAIKSAKSDEEYIFTIDLLCKFPAQLAACRYSCRVLVSVVEVCSEDTLDRLVGKLQLEQGVERYLGDKFASYMMVGLLLRNSPLAVNSLLKAINSNIRRLFECKCWKLFAVRLLKRNNSIVMAKIYKGLTSISDAQLNSLKRRTDFRLLYWAAVLACSTSLPQDSAALAMQTVELAVYADLEPKKFAPKTSFSEIRAVRQFNSLRSV